MVENGDSTDKGGLSLNHYNKLIVLHTVYTLCTCHIGYTAHMLTVRTSCSTFIETAYQ